MTIFITLGRATPAVRVLCTRPTTIMKSIQNLSALSNILLTNKFPAVASEVTSHL